MQGKEVLLENKPFRQKHEWTIFEMIDQFWNDQYSRFRIVRPDSDNV